LGKTGKMGKSVIGVKPKRQLGFDVTSKRRNVYVPYVSDVEAFVKSLTSDPHFTKGIKDRDQLEATSVISSWAVVTGAAPLVKLALTKQGLEAIDKVIEILKKIWVGNKVTIEVICPNNTKVTVRDLSERHVSKRLQDIKQFCAQST
jgi:hypothetical protein